jgi:hypothetical protein
MASKEHSVLEFLRSLGALTWYVRIGSVRAALAADVRPENAPGRGCLIPILQQFWDCFRIDEVYADEESRALSPSLWL